MKQLEKEIAETNKQSMMKRYQLYGTKVSKLADKSQKNTGKGESKVMEYKDFVEQVKEQIQDFFTGEICRCNGFCSSGSKE